MARATAEQLQQVRASAPHAPHAPHAPRKPRMNSCRPHAAAQLSQAAGESISKTPAAGSHSVRRGWERPCLSMHATPGARRHATHAPPARAQWFLAIDKDKNGAAPYRRRLACGRTRNRGRDRDAAARRHWQRPTARPSFPAASQRTAAGAPVTRPPARPRRPPDRDRVTER